MNKGSVFVRERVARRTRLASLASVEELKQNFVLGVKILCYYD
jgi:hypothetical protein